MTPKKFPTPNLDKFIGPGEGERYDDMQASAQADIALAVEATTKVPDEMVKTAEIIMIECETSARGLQSHAQEGSVRYQYAANKLARIAKLRAWLESLTVAPKVEPVEKRCGTCAYAVPHPDNKREGFGDELLDCDCPVPSSVAYQVIRTPNMGADCPYWKAKP